MLSADDIKLIKYLKTMHPTLNGIKEIVGKAYAYDAEYVQYDVIINWLVKLLNTYGTENQKDLLTLIIEANNDKQFAFHNLGAPMGYYENWIRVLVSRIRLMAIKQFPNWPK